jgi:hypothetical protein
MPTAGSAGLTPYHCSKTGFSTRWNAPGDFGRPWTVDRRRGFHPMKAIFGIRGVCFWTLCGNMIKNAQGSCDSGGGA